MNDGVEDDVRDEQVDGLGRKLCFVQVNRQKDGGDANAEGRVANEPVSPVELKTDPISHLFYKTFSSYKDPVNNKGSTGKNSCNMLTRGRRVSPG